MQGWQCPLSSFILKATIKIFLWKLKMQHNVLLMLICFMTKSLSSSCTIFIVSGGTITHTAICNRKEKEQLTRIIPYRLPLKKMTRRCCFLSLHLSFTYWGKIRLLYIFMNINNASDWRHSKLVAKGQCCASGKSSHECQNFLDVTVFQGTLHLIHLAEPKIYSLRS